MKTRAVNKYKEPFDVYIGRGSKWGNPFVIGRDGDRAEVIAKHKELITHRIISLDLDTNDFKELVGKRLGCFCKPAACHGDYLAELADQFWGNDETSTNEFGGKCD